MTEMGRKIMKIVVDPELKALIASVLKDVERVTGILRVLANWSTRLGGKPATRFSCLAT
jgi:hypothetical protein